MIFLWPTFKTMCDTHKMAGISISRNFIKWQKKRRIIWNFSVKFRSKIENQMIDFRIWLLDQDIWPLLVPRLDNHGGCSWIWSDFYFELHLSEWTAILHFPSQFASLSRSCCKCCASFVDFIAAVYK
jgi:hypothetical protein